MKKNRLVLLIIGFFVFLNVSAAPSVQQQRLTLILDWFVNPDHAPIILAQEKGYFKEQGLDVEIIVPSNPSDPPKWVAVGKADLAIDYQPNWLIEVGQGLPLQQVGALVAQPLSCMAVLEKGPVKKLQDIKGRRIASSAGAEDIILNTMLKHIQLNKKNVEVINVGFNLTQALLSKKVDGVMGVMRNVEPVEMAMMGYHTRLFYPEDYGFPYYDELIFVANKKNIKDERIRKFLLGVKKAVIYLRQNPQASWSVFVKNHPELNNGKNYKIWQKTLPLFSASPENWSQERCLAIISFFQAQTNYKIGFQACQLSAH